MRTAARVYIAAVAGGGFLTLAGGISIWRSEDPARFLCYLLLALLAATLKVKLPGISGTISVIFFFILLSIAQLSLSETLVLGCSAALLQCFWHARMHPQPVHALFNVTAMALSVAPAYLVYRFPLRGELAEARPLLLLLSATIFFLANTISIATVIALTEQKKIRKVWFGCYVWSLPYYLVGAGMAGLLTAAGRYIGWETSLLVLPIVYIMYRSYHLYLGRLEDEKKHVEEIAGLHLRTIEALAMAIDAKDNNTHDHLRRVQVYAVEIGRDLGLGDSELQALRAAAVLHDIGKLAVPEHIISKPGRLSPEEFEKMKIHPIVGAEILEQVKFPYPVAATVRAHHERWDGTGYPDGLQGEAIPIGARILAAVDCLDALASDRQYRRALPLEKAMAKVALESGTGFDPRVVHVLQRRHVELERMAQAQSGTPVRICSRKVARGVAPGAGYENIHSSDRRTRNPVDFLSSIAAARQEVQLLYELSQELGSSLSLDETLSLLAVRLKRIVPYDCIAVYLAREGRLLPQYVNGENFRLFSSLEIPIGDGLSGWVAQNRRPIVNGNPSVEPGYLNDPSKYSTLRSALAVPLEGAAGVLGVLTLYHCDKDAFTTDHLRILLASSPKIARSIENALRFRQVELSATTDALTGLANARSLFLHLDSELARARRAGESLAVLVCELDGIRQVSERHGHLRANRVLAEFARDMRTACREYDYAARLGGGEFVLVLPGLKPEGLDVVIQRLRRAAQEAALAGVVTGEAFFPLDGEDAEELLAEADRRMFSARRWSPEPLLDASAATVQ